MVQIALPCKRVGTASALHTFILEIFRIKLGLTVLFTFPNTWANSASSCWTYFSFKLITVQRDPTQSGLFIILQVHSTIFGCQLHPSSWVHKTVTTVSGTVQLPPSNMTKQFTLHVSGVNHTHHQEYINCNYSFRNWSSQARLCHVGRRQLHSTDQRCTEQ